MVSTLQFCPRNTEMLARSLLNTVPTKPYPALLEQVIKMGAVTSIGLPPGRLFIGKKPEDIKIALIRPLGSLTGDEEQEAVKEMGEPYQLELLASILLSQGYQVKVFDQLASPYDPKNPTTYPKTRSDADLITEVIAYGPDLAGFSTFTYNFRRGLSIASRIKKSTGIPILFGGYHTTSIGKQYLLFDKIGEDNPVAAAVFKQDLRNLFQHGIVDYACIGEGLNVISDVLLVLQGLKQPEAVAGLAFLKGDDLHVSVAPRADPNLYPTPYRSSDFDPMRYYATGRGYPFFLLMTANGCRFSCEYCSTGAMNYHGVRYRAISDVISELIGIRERFHSTWPCQKIMVNIIDEDFASSPRRVIALCKAIYDAGLHNFFEFNSFLDNLSILGPYGHEMLGMMHEAGFVFCFIGIESMLGTALDGYNRPDKFSNRPLSVQAAIDKLAEHGILYFGDHMSGYPLHSSDDLVEDYKQLLQLRRMHYAYFPILAPMPGTPIYWRAIWGQMGHGFLPHVTYDDLDANHQVLAIQDGREVKSIRDKSVQSFFERPEYETDADQAIKSNPNLLNFFARMLRKISQDYPQNDIIQRLSEKYQS